MGKEKDEMIKALKNKVREYGEDVDKGDEKVTVFVIRKPKDNVEIVECEVSEKYLIEKDKIELARHFFQALNQAQQFILSKIENFFPR